MQDKNQQIQRVIHRFALGTALIVALILPSGYGYVTYRDLSDSLDFKAQIKASALSGLIASAPDVWMFAENRIQGLISREPVLLHDELVQVLDGEDRILTQSGHLPHGPKITKSYPLHDAGKVVGQISVSGSANALYRETLISTLIGCLIGAIIYAIVKTVPLRSIRSITNELFKEKDRAETTLASIGDAVLTTDADGNINYLNPVAEKLLGYLLRDVRGRHVADVVRLYTQTGEIVESSLHQALKTNTIISCQGNNELRRANGALVAIEERAAPINDINGAVIGGVVILRDVSVAREYVQRRSWEATHDALTGLFNRREFENRVQLALEDAQTCGRCHALCYMDLDRFKLVNDACGHAAGDELLIKLAQLMQGRVRDTDTLARLGGDEFGLLLEGCDEKQGQLIAQEIMAAINEFSFCYGQKTFSVGVSIGLTAITHEHISVAEAVGEADCACYWAKEKGKDKVLVFVASDMNLAARRSETGWVGRINDAFQNNRFVLYYQPYKVLNKLAGFGSHLEVLLRMIGEDGEIIAPGRFLPAAERYNLMPAIDRWVIHEVFSRYSSLAKGHGEVPLTCAINLSGASINSEGFLEFIRRNAQQYQLGPDTICFELTESVAVHNLQVAAEFMNECKSMGFRFALDDFGTGTSSFGYLKNLPVDYLKIDGSFVKNLEHDSVDYTMVVRCSP